MTGISLWFDHNCFFVVDNTEMLWVSDCICFNVLSYRSPFLHLDVVPLLYIPIKF